jgi:hypothetical protein
MSYRSVKGNEALTLLPSSPPTYRPISHQNRNTSTNSGYFRRAELFGRLSSSPTVPPLLSSRGLARIEERRRAGSAMPGDEPLFSPLARLSPAHHTAIRRHLSSPSLREKRSKHHTNPDLGSSSSFRRNSTTSLRSQLDCVSENEWIEAGAPEREIVDDGYGPGPTLQSKSYFHFRREKKQFGRNKQNTYTPVHPYDARVLSPAEEALRQISSTAPSSQPLSHKSRWTGKLFTSCDPIVKSYSPTESRFSEESVSEFDYVEPHSAIESPKDILARARARDALHKSRRSDNSAETTKDCADSGLKDYLAMIGAVHDTEHLSSKSMDDCDGERLELDSSPSVSWESRSEDKLGWKELPLVQLTAEALLAMPNTSSTEFTSDPNHVSSIENLRSTSAPDQPALQEIPASPHQLTMTLSPLKQKLSCSGIVTTIDQTPSSVKPDLVVSSPITVLEQEPRSSQLNLSMSSIQEVIIQPPPVTHSNHGLSFASVSAIIHGCMTFAALRFMLSHLGHDVQIVNLASDLGIAFLIGVTVCAVCILWGMRRVKNAPGNALWVMGELLSKMKRGMMEMM